MVPKINKGGITQSHTKGEASAGTLQRQFSYDFSSLDSSIGSLGDLANTARGIYTDVNGTTQQGQRSPSVTNPNGRGVNWKSPALLAVAALAVIGLLFFALRKK